jgi:predicted heme/steroid binding protein
MAGFNWAYIDVDSVVTMTGPTNSILFISSSAAASGSGDLTFDSTTGQMAHTGTYGIQGSISSSSDVSGSYFWGDGSNLTNLPAASTFFNTFSASFSVLATYDVVGINTSGSVVTASLPAAASIAGGKKLIFKDIGGSGSVNNLVVEPSGSETVDGSTSGVKIQINYGSITITSDGVNSYSIVSAN